MPRWLLAWQREAEVSKTWDKVFSLFDFAEEVSRTDTRGEYRFKRSGSLFDLSFEWLVEPGEEAIYVREKSYISGLWFWFTSLTLIGSIASLVLGLIIEGLYNLLFLAACIVLLVFFLLLMTRVFDYRGPMNDFFSGQSSHDSYHPFLSLLLSVAVVLLPGLWLKGVFLQAALVVIGVFCIGYYRFSEVVEEYSVQWQKRYADFLKSFPMVASDYVLLLLQLSFPVIFFLLVSDLRVFILLNLAFPIVTFVFYFVSVVVLFLLTVVMVSEEQYQVGRARFESTGGNISSNRSALLTGVVVLGTSLGFISLCYLFLDASARFLSVTETHFAVGIVFASSLPIIFLLTGFCYQIWSFVSSLYYLMVRMEKRELSGDYDTETDTYVLDHSGYFAGAGTFLWRDFIVVSKGLVDELEDDELDAVVAHEECHIVSRDSKLAVLAAILSPLIGVGKNVAYSLLDFREREFRADRYAVERTSRDQLRSALEKMSVLTARASIDEEKLNAVTPTLAPVLGDYTPEDDSIFQRYFGLFFGNFAVTDVHASLDERRRRIEWGRVVHC